MWLTCDVDKTLKVLMIAGWFVFLGICDLSEVVTKPIPEESHIPKKNNRPTHKKQSATLQVSRFAFVTISC